MNIKLIFLIKLPLIKQILLKKIRILNILMKKLKIH